MPMSSGMTLWIICPSVSVVSRSGPRPFSRARPPLDSFSTLPKPQGVEVGDDYPWPVRGRGSISPGTSSLLV